MNQPDKSPIILLGARLLSPFIMIFGLYVIFHGHYSPGGGFQGGALLAAAVLLVRIAAGEQIQAVFLPVRWLLPLAIAGVAIYFSTGLVGMLAGGDFLDYEELPFPGMKPEYLRYWGILIVEVGIGMAVMAILSLIYDNLVKGEDRD